MKILSAEQTQKLDAYTIAHKPIPSIELMEQASIAFVSWFQQKFPDTDRHIAIFCGPGNNGGDGLAVARLLHRKFYKVHVFRCLISDQLSDDNATNLKRLPGWKAVDRSEIQEGDPLPDLFDADIILDALFGSGLNRPVEGYWASLLEHLNAAAAVRVAIDIPSGMFADQHTASAHFCAHLTATFELPKLAFFLPENHEGLGNWEVLPIGLSRDYIRECPCTFFMQRAVDLSKLLRPRHRHAHKGTFGHALLICGSQGMLGAAQLATEACLRSGVGLLTIHLPKCGYQILQSQHPEALVSMDHHEKCFTAAPDLSTYAALGIGPGLGQSEQTERAVLDTLQGCSTALLIDADALNIISKQPDPDRLLPKGAVITPHPKEFDRLFGESQHSLQRINKALKKAVDLGIVIVLKGGNTLIATPEGQAFFNNSGNPGMATGGSGDVLTGLITGLLAQGYSPVEAARLGVFLHGLAGDFAAETLSQPAMIASDITAHLGNAFKQLRP